MRDLSKVLDWKTVLYVWVLIHAVVLWIGGLVMALATANWWWLLLWLPCARNGWMGSMTNREYNRMMARTWRKNNPEKSAAIARRYYEAHKAEIAARRKARKQETHP